MNTTNTVPVSEHFRLEQVADDVYAAIATQGGAAFSNAGIVDLGDQTLIFDTFETPQAAEDLRAAAEQLTGRPATCVIISHAHADHWLGNQVFAGHAPIITTHKIREQMPAFSEHIQAFQKDPSHVQTIIQENQERLATERDPHWRSFLERSNVRWRHVLDALPTLDLRLPNQTFEGELIFHGTRRTVELRTWDDGHTASDCFLVLPGDKVALMGDVAFFQCQPFMPYGDPQAWVALLEKMEGSDIETFVPGHGPVGTKADLALQRRYITTMKEWVARRIEDGVAVEQAVQQPLPAPFAAWSGSPARFEANVRFLYQHLSEEQN